VLTKEVNQAVMVTETVTSITGSVDLGIMAASATHFSLSAPADSLSGMSFDVTVTALDPFENVDSNYSGTIHFTTTDADPNVVVPDDYTFTSADSGIHNFSSGVILISAGDQTLTVTDAAAAI